MITLRQAGDRHHDGRRRSECWQTFRAQDPADTLAGGFAALESLTEMRLSPGASVRRPPPLDAEIITYVRHGGLAHEDSPGEWDLIDAGEFQRRSEAGGVRGRDTNASRADPVHVFRVRFRPSTGLVHPGREQRRFGAAHRRDRLCLVASPDARDGSLRLRQDALVYSTILESGHHVIHELAPGRVAWLHVIHGHVTLVDLDLTGGDGAGLAGERAVSFRAQAESELLLLDLGPATSIASISG